MAQAYYGTKLSERISQTPEGFLICKAAVLARTGEQQYRGHEVGLPGAVITVHRPAEEVFDERFLASLEGKPIVDGHPSIFVTADTAAWSAKGHVQNVRRGPRLKSGEGSIIADLFVTDATLIAKILNGQMRELSVGYDVQYVPNEDGSLTATQLRANHVAVVARARGGSELRVYDRMPDALLRGDAMSWDELAEILAKLTTGDEEMANEQNNAAALRHLRNMRPLVERTGNRRALDQLDSAIRSLRSNMHSTVLAADAGSSARHSFLRSESFAERVSRVRAEESVGRSFEEAAADARARMLGKPTPEAASRAADSSHADEDWASAHRRAGEEMRNAKR